MAVSFFSQNTTGVCDISRAITIPKSGGRKLKIIVDGS